MPIQFYMRGYNTATSQYIDWVVNDQPDATGTYSGVNPGDLTNITINRLVTSKVDNFLKPSFPDYLNINTTDGPYLFHLNSYDWLHPTSTPADPPIPAPTNKIGIAVSRGTIDSNFPNPTPRNYSTIFWDEPSGSWNFGLLSPTGLVSSYTPITAGDLYINGTLSVSDGGVPAQTGTIRIPNSKKVTSRNSAGSSDLEVIGLDTFDRVALGAASVPVYIKEYQVIDGFIAESSASNGDLSNTATSGFIRLKNNTSGISFKSNTPSSNDASIVATDSSDRLYLGDIYNSGVFYGTSISGGHYYLIDNNLIAGITSTGFYFGDDVFSPEISQLSKTVGNGQNLSIKSQSSVAALSYGGSLLLSSGTGTTGNGYVDFKDGTSSLLRLYGATTPVVTDYTQNSSLNPNSVVLYNPNLRFYNTAPTGVEIKFDPINVATTTALPFKITGQSNIGVGSTGGDLYLSSGTGTSSNGVVALRSGNTSIAEINSDKFITKKGRRRNAAVVSSDYLVNSNDDFVVVDLSVNNLPIAITLPASPSTGDTHDIKDGAGLSNTYNITIQGNGKNIDGYASIVLNCQYSSVTLIYNGTQWNII